jgi:oxygen-independent coproporphyrinogen-3 oxidase
VRDALGTVSEFNLYLHLPFCEMSCPFCPYETHVVSGADSRVDLYLRALAQEMDMLAPGLRNAKVQTLYLGGGTATVLSGVQFEGLFGEIRKHFALDSESVICVETSPNALIQDAGKIDMLKKLSVKRISVGVQTLSEAPVRSEGRTHDPGETVEILKRLIGKFDVVNVDLMQDMPGQTDADLQNDIDQIAQLGPSQVTWYVERLRRSHGRFPDAYQSVQRRLWIRDRMKEISYRPSPGGRFVRSANETDAFKKIRCGLDSHLVGLGASAYGHVPGYFYRNVLDTAAYTDMVLAGHMPAASGFHLRKIDVLAGALATGIRWGAALGMFRSGNSGQHRRPRPRLRSRQHAD